MTLCVSPMMEASRKVRGSSMEASVRSTEASIICNDVCDTAPSSLLRAGIMYGGCRDVSTRVHMYFVMGVDAIIVAVVLFVSCRHVFPLTTPTLPPSCISVALSPGCSGVVIHRCMPHASRLACRHTSMPSCVVVSHPIPKGVYDYVFPLRPPPRRGESAGFWSPSSTLDPLLQC